MVSAFKGAVTVFLSMIILLILSMVGGLLEAASLQVAKNYGRTNVDLGMESVFAEYSRELLEEYQVFALDGAYGNEQESDHVLTRLTYYTSGASEMEHEIVEKRLMTDQMGADFGRQAVAYMKEKYGLSYVEPFLPQISSWNQVVKDADAQKEASDGVNKEVEQGLLETEQTLDSVDNPITEVEEWKKSGILQKVHPNPEQISSKGVNLSTLPSNRTLRTGNMAAWDKEGGLTEQLLFQEYLLLHFQTAAKGEGERSGLSYEVEYMLEGKATDRENLEGVANRLLFIRMVPNYMKLQGDSAKQAEAEALSLSIATALLSPQLSPLIKQGILIAWAYEASVEDVKMLLSGGKVSLFETAEDAQQGLDYNAYLRILLLTEKKETVRMRALDMLEVVLRQKDSGFRADNLITGLKVRTVCQFRRRIQYQFDTFYQYR